MNAFAEVVQIVSRSQVTAEALSVHTELQDAAVYPVGASPAAHAVHAA
jgi:hypothetical protein